MLVRVNSMCYKKQMNKTLLGDLEDIPDLRGEEPLRLGERSRASYEEFKPRPEDGDCRGDCVVRRLDGDDICTFLYFFLKEM